MSELTPEVRKELLTHLTQACHLWMEEILESFFGDDPRGAASHQIMIEALGAAICLTANKVPTAPALLHTFALEVLDNVENQNEGN